MTFLDTLQHSIMHTVSRFMLAVTNKWNNLVEEALNDPTTIKYTPEVYRTQVGKILNEQMKPAYNNHAIAHIQYTQILNDMTKEK